MARRPDGNHRQAARDAAQQVEQEEANVPAQVLDIGPEHEQKQHVEENMQKAAV